LTSPITATITIPASTAFGRKYKVFVKNNNAIQTNITVNTLDIPVFAQAVKFTALLENDQLIGYHLKNQLVILPSHCHISS
jgi:hypothetical protein